MVTVANRKLSHISGCYDIGFDTLDGSYRSKNSAFIWIGRNVYIFHFHNNFIFNQGKYYLFLLESFKTIDFNESNPSRIWPRFGISNIEISIRLLKFKLFTERDKIWSNLKIENFRRYFDHFTFKRWKTVLNI